MLLLCGALAACQAESPARQPAPDGYNLPALSGRVVDRAELIPPSVEEGLAIRLAEVEAQSNHQFVVVTVPSLGGHDIVDYGVALGRHWGIGRKDFDDGVLLLVAPKEHKIRIEVGRGLEGALTDVEAGQIIRNEITPRFRAGQVADGIVAGSERIIREIVQ